MFQGAVAENEQMRIFSTIANHAVLRIWELCELDLAWAEQTWICSQIFKSKLLPSQGIVAYYEKVQLFETNDESHCAVYAGKLVMRTLHSPVTGTVTFL